MYAVQQSVLNKHYTLKREKRIIVRKIPIALLLILSLFLGFSISALALPKEQEHAIQSFVNEARRISGTSGISASVVVDGETYFFSSGLANSEAETPADEETLWELASVSKAFTALGVLYLEEQGLLSLDDSIADHLPWLTFWYRGQPVDMQGVRLYHFMHHTSGLLLNSEPGLTLQGGVEALVNAELAFFPGESFAYGNGNYNILGLVIETVSGQSYEAFMEEHIFRPLGMTQTFANRDYAVATGQFAQGYATQFIFFTVPRDARETESRVPTGFLISSAQDMARWMGIQLGLVTDIPEIFHTIIPRTHESGHWVVQWDGYYTAGWFVSAEGDRIDHGGLNHSFSTFALLLPEEQIGITVLANSCQTINATLIADSIADILGGDLEASYRMGGIQIMDVVFTLVTILGGAFAVIFFIFGLRRRKQDERQPRTKKRIVLIILWSVITLALIVFSYAFPRTIIPFGSWSFALTLVSLSFLTAFVALALLSASITWFVAFPRRRE